MVPLQPVPDISVRLAQFVLALVFLFGVVPAVYLIGRLFDRVF